MRNSRITRVGVELFLLAASAVFSRGFAQDLSRRAVPTADLYAVEASVAVVPLPIVSANLYGSDAAPLSASSHQAAPPAAAQVQKQIVWGEPEGVSKVKGELRGTVRSQTTNDEAVIEGKKVLFNLPSLGGMQLAVTGNKVVKLETGKNNKEKDISLNNKIDEARWAAMAGTMIEAAQASYDGDCAGPAPYAPPVSANLYDPYPYYGYPLVTFGNGFGVSFGSWFWGWGFAGNSNTRITNITNVTTINRTFTGTHRGNLGTGSTGSNGRGVKASARGAARAAPVRSSVVARSGARSGGPSFNLGSGKSGGGGGGSHSGSHR